MTRHDSAESERTRRRRVIRELPAKVHRDSMKRLAAAITELESLVDRKQTSDAAAQTLARIVSDLRTSRLLIAALSPVKRSGVSAELLSEIVAPRACIQAETATLTET